MLPQSGLPGRSAITSAVTTNGEASGRNYIAFVCPRRNWQRARPLDGSVRCPLPTRPQSPRWGEMGPQGDGARRPRLPQAGRRIMCHSEFDESLNEVSSPVRHRSTAAGGKQSKPPRSGHQQSHHCHVEQELAQRDRTRGVAWFTEMADLSLQRRLAIGGRIAALSDDDDDVAVRCLRGPKGKKAKNCCFAKVWAPLATSVAESRPPLGFVDPL
ncbi:hypothetical protein ANO11243_063720 [Dothideomycetidae sp. 11243]|nr:hypothetical protein ANO11243_063720 [fungal sp. No.11243]